MDELKSQYLCFWSGHNKWEAECLAYKPGTYMSVANKGAFDLWTHIECEKHQKAIRGETSPANVTGFLPRKRADQMTLC
jgi:hypothetical protein